MRLPSLLLGSVLSFSAFAQDYPFKLIIKYKENSSLASLLQQLQTSKEWTVDSLTPIAGGAYNLSLHTQSNLSAENELQRVINQLKKDPRVLYVVKDRIGHFKPMAMPDDSSLSELNHALQWDEFTAPGGIMLESGPGKMDGAWLYTNGESSKPTVVAVLDTGVEQHMALMYNLLKDSDGNIWGWNFAGNNRNLSDETGSYHGTHVAGTIAAVSDTMLGVGQQLKILPLKIPDASGMFYESQVINAIYWAVGGEVPGVPHNPYPAKVLNMSFGVDERPGKEVDHCDEALQEAMFFARKQGAVVTVAAGNDNEWEHYNAPGVCNGAIKVASTGPEGLRAYYSNYGPGVSFAAPGGDARYGRTGAILSTVKPGGGYQHSGYDFYQGTSMASPHAAGVAGLVFAIRDGQISPEKVEQILYATTHPFGQTSDSNKSCTGTKPCGHGILDAENAVKTAAANFDAIISPPSFQDLNLKKCRNHQLTSQPLTNSEWKLINKRCQSEDAYFTPEVHLKGQQIVLNYQGASYVRDISNYKHCELISRDSVGCYY
ncbi:serine metalloprotease [Legionella birminghamensis]|uniref:AprE, Subtilisin-like serine protease n=1 Tax=Legionella birminghamensis TaxID=28083 RepID=A0A378I8Q9_9GAMM|nr:S8 family serine peptidase [Legionella birminghamensis]KTC68094.1 serine metalloprotease [Legionella birminghamensis]STX31196.1 AprE, Subtilisin-like serine protease [Legionella birminghamensis]